jgi:hypothetical protein
MNRPPSLQTGQADFPHPAFQSVGLLQEGAALRLVPKSGVQTSGVDQVNYSWLTPPLASPCGHSLRYGPLFGSPFFHLPASLRSTVVTRFLATTDALTSASQMRGLLAQRTH